jgi:ribosomal protein S12 methylthiotransferase
MHSGSAGGARLYIHTLGCPKNEADSRALARALGGCGVVLEAEPEHASHILINTCGFITDAKEESIAAILEAAGSCPGSKLLVMGCLVERYRDELRKGIPEVEAWFGLADNDALGALVDLLGQGPEGGRRVLPARPSPSAHAYLKISDGCDEPCAFCAIPAIKGPYHSTSAEELLREADACLAEGAKELVLVGQDTTLWRSGNLDLPGLIDQLAADERVRRLRVMYLQPDRVDEGFLRYMAGQPKLCRYLDVPFQHSHPDVLRRMCRAGDADTYLGLIERARRLLPDVSVRTSLIVGFPGETERHFEHLLEFVDQAGFDYAGGFVYSPEEGTPAAELRPRVRKLVALDRLNRLNAALLAGSERKHQALVGERVEVMIDSTNPADLDEGVVALGRTRGQAPDVDGVTYVEGTLPPGAAPGDMVVVTVESAVGFDLVGRCDAS